MRHFQSPNGRIVIFIEKPVDLIIADVMLQRALNTWDGAPADLLELADRVKAGIAKMRAEEPKT